LTWNEKNKYLITLLHNNIASFKKKGILRFIMIRQRRQNNITKLILNSFLTLESDNPELAIKNLQEQIENAKDNLKIKIKEYHMLCLCGSSFNYLKSKLKIAKTELNTLDFWLQTIVWLQSLGQRPAAGFDYLDNNRLLK
jgi:hypothetical protein